jgi:microcystin-dependent protein
MIAIITLLLKRGGEKKHELKGSEIPSHTHDISWTSYSNDNDESQADRVCRGHSDAMNVVKTTTSFGGGQTHENRPPFYTMLYIMRVK